jgi:hypothetical protein
MAPGNGVKPASRSEFGILLMRGITVERRITVWMVDVHSACEKQKPMQTKIACLGMTLTSTK